jgi:GNAT superfamily N-acetyltransferase
MKNIKIDFNPTLYHLKEIEKWLIDEDFENDEGFYCNWDTIVSSFDKKQLIIAIFDNKVIGFLTYFLNTYSANIEIIETHPDYRKKGFGTALLNSTLDYFTSRDKSYVELQCSPESSVHYWKKMGFTEFGMLGHVMAFKPLLNTLELANESTDNRLELYNVRRHEIERHTEKWEWNLEFERETDKLINPIIFPAMSFWALRWVKDGKEVEMDELKYFQNRSINGSSCMIVKELKESLINN